MSAAKRWAFVLINLEGAGDFFFDLFPKEIQTTGRAVWEQQDTTIGVKPIFYANRDPKRITVPEVFLDRTDTQESIKPDIEALEALQAEVPTLGRPPALLAIWGDEQFRCVLEEVTINRKWFSAEGNPQRAMVTLQLLELQEESESVDVVVRDDVGPGDSGSGIGNF
jgi:hypothetical protein